MPPPATAGILKDPGPICPRQNATLTCEINGGLLLQWYYFTQLLAEISPVFGLLPPPNTVEVDGVEFLVSLNSTGCDQVLISELSFEPTIMNSSKLSCVGQTSSSVSFERIVPLQVQNISKLIRYKICQVRSVIPIQRRISMLLHGGG